MRSIFIAAALAAGSAIAGPVATFHGEHVTVFAYQEDCEVPSLTAFLAEFGKAKKAATRFGGAEIKACYVVQDDKVLIVDEDGNGGYIPVTAFKEAKSV
jgi:hypothetical protein